MTTRKRTNPSHPCRVVAIAGPDGCGKTTLAQLIEEQVSDRYECFHINIADRLKVEIKSLLHSEATKTRQGMNFLELNRAFTDKPTPQWARHLMRGWGDYKRQVDPLYWVAKWKFTVAHLELAYDVDTNNTKPNLVLCSDLRYVNELKAVHELGGVAVYLDDAGQSLSELAAIGASHQLLDVREQADIGFTINSKAKMWVDVKDVLEALEL